MLHRAYRMAVAVGSLILVPGLASAQTDSANDATLDTIILDEAATPEATPTAVAPAERPIIESITVTGSRIKRAAQDANPVLALSKDDLINSGITSIGDILQRISVSSSSLNTQFNSAGNFGFPADGGGVGSGSTTISLRNLGANRVLVLVDGVRWVNESSASGVSGAVDLNTIPFSAVERVEILTDGASALYGSDAIAGVVNIITRFEQEGIALSAYAGDHRTGDGLTQTYNLSFGDSGSRHRFFMDLSHFDQNRISSSEYEQASVPIPGTGVTQGSSATPFTRSVFFNEPGNDEEGGLCPQVDTDGDGTPDRALCDITANGVAGGPDFVQEFPDGFHQFTSQDRFNFAPFNLLLTPQERNALFVHGQFDFSTGITGYARVLTQSRRSQNQAAPEPIFIGPGAGTGGLADTVSVDETNPFNPFGITLDAEDNFQFAGRRPLEGGPRIFTQEVSTFTLATGLTGNFFALDRAMFWDVNLFYGSNRAQQSVQGTYNIANIARALGPVDDCTAPCVPLNFFGGPGTITQDMLDYIGFVEIARSEQEILVASANISGGLFDLPAGPLELAAGYEFRDLEGRYSPDPVVIRGEGNGVPSLPTRGGDKVNEAFVEFNVPLLAGLPLIQSLELNLATRFSDYDTFGSTTNNKFGIRWEIVDGLIARGTFAEGFRAPSVGELFGSPARFDATIEDPCSNATDPQIQQNCESMGVPPGFEQANPQIGVRTGGNPNLQPETADSLTAGIIYSPSWATGKSWSQQLDFEITYYDIELEDAIQAVDAQTQLDRCVATLDPAFCSGISRGPTGDINNFNNTLLNLGTVETDGLDFGVKWLGPNFAYGQPSIDWSATRIEQFRAINNATGLAEPRGVGIETSDSGIPRWRSTFRLNWLVGGLDVGYSVRYLSSLVEECGPAQPFASCSNPDAGDNGTNRLDSTFYHDLRAQWRVPGNLDLTLTGGINNLFDKDPPVCVSCSLNGYDASLYDLPGQFGYVQVGLRY